MKPPAPDALVELLGVLAYGELVAFDRMVSDARLAPDLRRRALLSEMAAAEMANYSRLSARLEALGSDPSDAMAPFVEPLELFHDSTEPRDWLEGLVKAYVGGGIADDFYREIAQFLADEDRDLVLEVLHDARFGDFVVSEVRAAIELDPPVGDRLGLWARRLVGEALSQAQRVAAERDSLTQLVLDGTGDLAGIGGFFKRLTAGHTARLQLLGLNP